MSMSHVYKCDECTSKTLVVVHPNGEGCPQLASQWYDLIELKVERNPNTGPGVKDEWVGHTVANFNNEWIQARIAELQSR